MFIMGQKSQCKYIFIKIYLPNIYWMPSMYKAGTETHANWQITLSYFLMHIKEVI